MWLANENESNPVKLTVIQSFQDFRFDSKSHLVDSINNITPNAAITYEVKHNISWAKHNFKWEEK